MNRNNLTIFNNYELKLWLMHAGPRRRELLQKLKRDLEKLNLSRRKVRKALLQLITKAYVVIDPLSKEIIRSINAKDRKEAFGDCNKFMVFLDDNKSKQNDGKNKKDFNYSENLDIYADQRKKNLDMDSTLEIVSKSQRIKFHLADNQRNICDKAFKHNSNERKESLDKYKMKQYELKCDYKKLSNTLSSKEVSRKNNPNEVISNSSSDTDLLIPCVRVPAKIDGTKLTSILGAYDELHKNKYHNNRSFDCTSKTMEADSTVSNYEKKNDLNVSTDTTDYKIEAIHEYKEYKRCKTVIIDKIQKNCSSLFNKSYSNTYKKKKRKIRHKFRQIFGPCLTMSEKDEEESIINTFLNKKEEKQSNESLLNLQCNDRTLILSETQDIISDLVANEDIVCKKTCEIPSIRLMHHDTASLYITNVKEFNEKINDQTICDEDVEVIETESYGDKNIFHFSTLCDNNKLIQIDDIVKVPDKIQKKDNVAQKYIKEPINLQTGTDSINVTFFNESVNDTNVKVLSDYVSEIKLLSDRSDNNKDGNNNNNNNNDHNNKDGNNNNNNLNSDSVDSRTKITILNPIINLDALNLGNIFKKSQNIDDHSEISKSISKADTSIDARKGRENNAIITNINLIESCKKNVKDYDAVDREIGVKPYIETCAANILKDLKKYEENVVNNDITKAFKQNINEDFSKLLQMNIYENYKIESNGNTISIQENLETDRNQNIVGGNFCISNIMSKKDLLSNDNPKNKSKKIVLEESIKINPKSPVAILIENNDTCNTLNENEIINETSLNTIDFKPHTSLDPSCNVMQPESIKRNKIRVLSSAELGSRWCPSPVNTSTNTSITELNITLDKTTKPINDNNVTSKTGIEQLTKDSELNNKPHNIKSYLMSIHRRIIRLRMISKYLLNDSQDLLAKDKNVNDMRLNSHSFVLLDELYNLGNELELTNLHQIIQYVVSVINDSSLLPECEPISLTEIVQYIAVLDKSLNRRYKSSSSNALISTSNNVMSTSDNTCTSVSNNVSISIVPVSNVTNVNNMAKTIIKFLPNLQDSVETQVQLNNLSKKHAHDSISPNQNSECNLDNSQTLLKSNTSALYPPLVQSINNNVRVLQDNRINNVSMPHYGQRVLPQISCQSNYKPQRIDNTKDTKDTSQLSYTQEMQQQAQQQAQRGDNLSCNTLQGLHPQTTIQNMQQTSYSTAMPSKQLPTLHFNHSQNFPQIMYAIPYDLLLQIWDQVTFCFEESFIDCTIHNSYDKSSCILELFQKEWRDKMCNFILYKSQKSEHIILQSKQAKYIYERAIIEKQRKIWQLNLQKKEYQNQLNAMKIVNKNMTSLNSSPFSNLELQAGATQFIKRPKKLVNIKLKKRSESRKLKSLAQHLINSTMSSDTLQNNTNSLLVEPNNTKHFNKLVSVKKTNRKKKFTNVEEPSTSLRNKTENQKNINEIYSISTNKDETNQEESVQVVASHMNEILLPKQRIEDNIDSQRCDSKESVVIMSEPHITDVRTISQNSFNAIEEVLDFPSNDTRLSTGDDNKQNEIQIKIQLPENIICLNCPKISTVVCEACLEAHYCSRECAALYWVEKHYKYCRPHCIKVSEGKV